MKFKQTVVKSFLVVSEVYLKEKDGNAICGQK